MVGSTIKTINQPKSGWRRSDGKSPMEPLSIATGTLTLLGALGATATGLNKLASLRHAPGQILQLCNEVSAF